MRRLLTILLLLLLLSAGTAEAEVTTLPAGGESPAGKTVSSCLQRSGRLLVDIEIDRSGSLKTSDPEDRRVDGVGAALLGLARLAESADRERGKPQVEVLLSSFAGTVAPRRLGRHWRLLDRSSVDSLLREAEGFAARDTGRDTDYALALSAASRTLNQRAQTVYDGEGAPPCKALVFLSDGKFHLGDRTDETSLPSHVFYAKGVELDRPGGGAEAVKAGQHYLCDPGGLRDRMVGADIVMFTVALSASGKLTPADSAALRGLTTGAGGECGSIVSVRTGQFVEARDSYDLFSIFTRIIPGGPGPPGGDGCQFRPPCPNPVEFTAIPGLSGFTLSASAPRRGVSLQLVAPDGQQTVLASGGPRRQDLGDVEVRQHWIQGRSMEVQTFFEPDARSWTGTWRFRFIAPDELTPVPLYDLNLQSDLRPEVVGDPQLATDADGRVELRLVDSTGHPISAGKLVEAAQLRVRVRDGAGGVHRAQVTEGRPGRFTLGFEVPREVPDGDWGVGGTLGYPGIEMPVESRLFDLHLPEPDRGETTPTWLLLAIGAGIVLVLTLAVLCFSYWRRLANARFTPPQILRVFHSEAVVTQEGELELLPPLGGQGLRFDDFRYLSSSGRDSKARRLSVPPFELTAKVPWRLRGRPRGMAHAGRRRLLAGAKGRPVRAGDESSPVEVALGLAGTWLFAIGPSDDEGKVTGHLAIFTDDDSPHDLGREVLEAARVGLREQDWQELAPAERGSEGEEAWPEEPGVDIEDIDWESI